MALMSLPAELLLKILSSTDELRTLRAFAKTCKYARKIAEPLIYETQSVWGGVQVPDPDDVHDLTVTPDNADAFLPFLDSTRLRTLVLNPPSEFSIELPTSTALAPALAKDLPDSVDDHNSVEVYGHAAMKIVTKSSHSLLSLQIYTFYGMQSLADSLSLCSNLTELSVTLGDELGDYYLDYTPLGGCTSLRSVWIYLEEDIESEQYDHLARSWRALERLQVWGTCLTNITDSFLTLASPTLKILSLKYDVDRIEADDLHSSEAFDSVHEHGQLALETIRLVRFNCCDVDFFSLLRENHPHLRRLMMYDCGLPEAFDTATYLLQADLETFTISPCGLGPRRLYLEQMILAFAARGTLPSLKEIGLQITQSTMASMRLQTLIRIAPALTVICRGDWALFPGETTLGTWSARVR